MTVALALAGFSGAALAQDRAPAPAMLLDPRSPAIVDSRAGPGSAGMVDETALRFYAAQKQAARVKAEIARLRRLYPGWTEPADLDSVRPSPPEEAPLWDLFTAGRFAELNAAIAALRAVNPGWQPSEELATKLKRAEFRSAIREAATRGPDLVLSRFRDLKDALDPADVETVWTIADAAGSLGQSGQATDLYRLVLSTSTVESQRLATFQKALARLPIASAEEVLSLAKPRPDGTPETAPIGNDVTRARIVAALHGEKAIDPGAADLAALRDEVRRVGAVDGQSLLAWYAYSRRQFREALDWFKLAVANGGDAMVAHGLAHTLRELGLDRDAEEVAFAWRDGFVGNSLLFVDLLERKLTQSNPAFVEPARLDRYARVVLATSSGEGAQALAWYAYNSCQFDSALEWFRRAAAWLPKEATLFGLALTYQRLRRQRDFLDLVNRYDGLFPTVVDLVFREPSDAPDPCAPAQAAAEPRPPSTPPAPAGTQAEAGRSRRGAPAPAAPAFVPQGLRRSEFPVAVAFANPLRFPTVAPAGRFVREPASGPAPLVARRVPGAGAMPYERLGFALMPGWNGQDAASTLPAPPAGTIWQEEESARARAPGRSAEAESGRAGAGAVSGPFVAAVGPTGPARPR